MTQIIPLFPQSTQNECTHISFLDARYGAIFYCSKVRYVFYSADVKLKLVVPSMDNTITVSLNLQNFWIVPKKGWYLLFLNVSKVGKLKFSLPCISFRFPLQTRHTERDGVSNHQPHDCLLNRLFWWRPNITVTSLWGRMRLKSPASWLFTQPFIRALIKENIKTPRHWPLWGEFIGDRWIPRTKG